MTALRLTLFADFACPYSYLTESALRAMDEARLEFDCRAFELFPDPSEPGSPVRDPSAWDLIAAMAEESGLSILARDSVPQTRKAHEAARFAADHGREAEFRAATYAALWSMGADIGRIDVLCDIGTAVGLDAEELKIALDIDHFEGRVAADQALATRLRVPGTPTLYLGTGRNADVLVGARPLAELREALSRALEIRTD